MASRPFENVPIDILRMMLHHVEMASGEAMIDLLCPVQETLDCVDIGVSTIIRMRIEVVKKFGNKMCHSPDIYAFASVGLSGEILSRRYKEDCYISYRVKEDATGFTLNSKLLPAMRASAQPTTVFSKKVPKGKLKGKFHLEVLFVDASKVGDKNLCEKYVSNINARFENPSDESTLKEKVKKAEKWLEQAKKKKEPSLNNIGEYKDSCGAENDTDFFRISRFPQSGGKTDHMFADRWYVSFPEEACGPKTDRAALYAYLANHIIKKEICSDIGKNTYTLIEFLLMDGYRIETKLRQHTQNGEDMLSATIKQHRLNSERLKSLFIVTVYAVDMPAFAPTKRVQSRLDFIRSGVEGGFICHDYIKLFQQLPNKRDMDRCVTGKMRNECTEPFEKNCNCEKLHVSNYCDVALLLHKNAPKMKIMLHRWSISLSDICLKIFNDTSIKDMYLRIAVQIIKNNFCESWNVGTNILCELEVNGKKYSTKLSHHSDMGFPLLLKHMFENIGESVGLHRQAVISVYVIHILKFASNEEAHASLANFIEDNRKVVVSGAKKSGHYKKQSPLKNGKNKLKNTTLSAIDCSKKTDQLQTKFTSSYVAAEISCMLQSKDFKDGSSLALKASIKPVPLQDGYNILSTRPINTSKNRILVFSVQMNRAFYENVRDSGLFVANICLDIAKFNEIQLWTEKKKKISVKVTFGTISKKVELNDEDSWNAVTLKQQMFEENMEITEKFHLGIRYRTM